MNVFISWSGNTSKQCANQIREFLIDCFGEKINVFMSSEDIGIGNMGINKILDTLYTSDCCIACITNMNIRAPWISFESGMVAGNANGNPTNSKLNLNKVIPILFGDINLSKFSNHPLSNFQFDKFNKKTLQLIFDRISDNICQHKSYEVYKRIENKINSTYKNINEILGKCPGVNSLTYDGLQENLETIFNFKSKACGNVTMFYSNFEPPILYKTLLEYSDKRLYVFGRKNTKLFSKEYRDFFNDLQRRTLNGFDFRCLFVSPDSPYLSKAQRGSNIKHHLIDRISSAYELIGNDALFENTCHSYEKIRENAIIIVDDVVVYTPIIYAEDGLPLPLTGCSFFITSIESEIGKSLLNQFIDAWNVSKPLKVMSSLS